MLGTPAVTNLYITRLLYTLCGFININDDESMEVIMGVKYERYVEVIFLTDFPFNPDGWLYFLNNKNINVQNVLEITYCWNINNHLKILK